MLQNNDSLSSVRKKGMWMFGVFHKLKVCFVVVVCVLFCLFFSTRVL